MKHPKKRKGEKPFLPGAVVIRNRLDFVFACRRISRPRLAHLLHWYRTGWGWMGDLERRAHLADLIALLRDWKPSKGSTLASWLWKAMEDFHLLQRRIFGPRLKISKAGALALASHWFERSVSPVVKGFEE